ncbi:methionyl-tRNA synthetase [Stagonosporopsis vannaccii]|nr:methionyl-tRNA synthetase [Stagonosporopsis vannaccii]
MRTRLTTSTIPALRSVYSSFSRNSTWRCSVHSSPRRFISSKPASDKPYYITTPIFYVNAAPHVGHLYTMVLTDIIKRWNMLRGKEAIMCTGTDEHGLKVQKAAAKAGVDAKAFCDKGANIFRDLARKAEISNDHFVRTTDQDHKDAVQYAWYLLQEKGLIYEQKHEGWYSIADECFYPPSGIQPWIEPSTGRKIMTSIETGSEVEWSSEQNYHFRLSAFREPLLDFYKANPEWIAPAHRMKEVIHAVESGLEDLSISRPYERLAWGIRVPDDDSQTIYVWLDALMNYATKAGYPFTPGKEQQGGWPADCHVIGKDIVRFHCIYWPAFLMALDLPLPKKILTHAHWTLGGAKMSKSTGRVVDPFHALDRYGPDVMRFYMAHDGGIQDDSSYDNSHIIKLYNKFLNQQLGNLVSRVTRGKKWSVRGAVERIGSAPADYWSEGPGSRFWFNSLDTVSSKVDGLFDAYDPRKALHQITELVRGANLFFQMSKPWDNIVEYSPGEPGEDVDRTIYLTAEALRMTGILLQPYMPNKAEMLLNQLGVRTERRTLEYCKPGADLDYGIPLVTLGTKHEGVLFPPLATEIARFLYHGWAQATSINKASAAEVGCLAFSHPRAFADQRLLGTYSLGPTVMAFNWDKLSKAQRDYPKPRFALSYIDKLLKKNPGNPYLTTWRADVSLQLQSQPEAVTKSLRDVCQNQSTLQDELLLEYAYRLIVEATTRSNPKLDHINTVGNEGLKAWQNAATLKTTKKDRKDMWDALFTTAMRQGCWDDVRTAIVKYRLEGASSDKLTYYTQIFAQQMSAEQKIQASHITGVADRMAEIQLGVALKQMKDAYERPESDPICVKDIRDLRFMAKIYARQGKHAELLELWQAPPAHLQPIMEKHALDISLLTVDILANAQNYKLLEKHVLGLIETAISAADEGNYDPLRQLCSARVNIWTCLIDASKELYPSAESKNKVTSIKERVFSAETLKLDRPLRLVRLKLRIFLEESLLQDCKEYWEHFARTPSCFKDLRSAVEKMSDEERISFLSHIEEDVTASKPTVEGSKADKDNWARAEICALKFKYLIAVSLKASQSSQDELELLVKRASSISQQSPTDPDPIMLIAYCLAHMHHKDAEPSATFSPNSRILLQAAMLVRAAVERDVEKENRPLALLATRLHLNLGLGRVAFQTWRHVKVKEMLVDTLSPYLLTRIALTQPFDVKHHQGFSADKELKHVVDTINRMSRVQEGLIFRDIKRFHWDSAFDLISMNDKLTSSLTKHSSILERRRIARLKGEPAGDLPDVKYRNAQSISDNIDRAVFPAYEHYGVHQPYSFLMPADIPSADYITAHDHNRECISKILYRDGLPTDWAPTSASEHKTGETPAERLAYENFWHPISALLYSALNPDAKADAKHFTALIANLKQLCRDQEKLMVTTATGKEAVDEPTMISENMLVASYSALEVLRALPRLATEVRERVVQSKTPHPMKSQVPKDWAKEVDAEVKSAFEAVGKVASSYIALLQKRGAIAFKAQVMWGQTGEALKPLLSDDDVDFYAREYVDAAVEAWKGVQQVKLK